MEHPEEIVRSREDIITDLFLRTTLGIRLGIDRIAKAAEQLGNPQNAYKSIHVAGTNGKGSVCAFLESIFRHQGYSTGLFTSPHIVRFEERYIISGKPVTSEEWLEVYQDIEDIVNQHSLTFFEISALIAFELFKRKKVDWAILETGLGGRLDATNIVIPRATVITNIGIDHTEYLGSDLFSIAGEKLGIVKEKVPCIIAEQTNKEVVELARKVCEENNSPCIIANQDEISDIIQNEYGSRFSYNNTQFTISLHGSYQVINALCAIKTYEILGIAEIETIVEAVSSTFLPARFQCITVKGKDVVFDVAHNPQAIEEFCSLLNHKYGDVPVCIVTGVMADKDVPGILQKYAACAETIVLTRPNIPRAAQPSELAELMPDTYKGHIKIIDTVEEAVRFTLKQYDGVICIVGSFYLVGEAMEVLQIGPYYS